MGTRSIGYLEKFCCKGSRMKEWLLEGHVESREGSFGKDMSNEVVFAEEMEAQTILYFPASKWQNWF